MAAQPDPYAKGLLKQGDYKDGNIQLSKIRLYEETKMEDPSRKCRHLLSSNSLEDRCTV